MITGMRTIGWLIYSIARNLGRLGEGNRKRFGLGGGKALFLKIILENPGISQTDLCDETGLDKTTTAKSVKKLIEDNYIYKKRNKNDGRYYKLYPAKRAPKIHELLNKEFKHHSRVLLKGFSPYERDMFLSFLNRLYINLNEEIYSSKNEEQKEQDGRDK